MSSEWEDREEIKAFWLCVSLSSDFFIRGSDKNRTINVQLTVIYIHPQTDDRRFREAAGKKGCCCSQTNNWGGGGA